MVIATIIFRFLFIIVGITFNNMHAIPNYKSYYANIQAPEAVGFPGKCVLARYRNECIQFFEEGARCAVAVCCNYVFVISITPDDKICLYFVKIDGGVKLTPVPCELLLLHPMFDFTANTLFYQDNLCVIGKSSLHYNYYYNRFNGKGSSIATLLLTPLRGSDYEYQELPRIYRVVAREIDRRDELIEEEEAANNELIVIEEYVKPRRMRGLKTYF
jgi:hypothetical protein